MSNKFDMPSTVEKKCSLKCNLFYNYSESPNITITRGKNNSTVTDFSYLLISSDDITSKNPVLYNSAPYIFTGMYLYNGGIHKYGGATPTLEIVMKHTSPTGALYLCIPVFSTSSNTTNNLVDKIITTYNTSTTGPVYMQSFNLGYIIPKSKYIVHTGIYRNGDGVNDVYITFPSNSFYLNAQTLNRFASLCLSAYAVTYSYTTMSLYQNDKGTSENGFSGEGQIYIDCQPTDSEGDIVYKAQGPASMPPINVQTLITVVISILFFIFSIYMLRAMKTSLQYSKKALVASAK